MSQYYIWANPDKREYIDDDPFEGIGFTLGCSAAVGQQMTDAACTMIAGPWRGDTVIYVGDYWTGSAFDDERSHRLFAKFDGYPYEDILKRFENVTGRFEEARGHKYGDYLHFEERGDVFDEPYTGPFDMRVRSWRYAVNARGESSLTGGRDPSSAQTIMPDQEGAGVSLCCTPTRKAIQMDEEQDGAQA